VHVRNLSTRTDEKKLQEKLEKYGNISKIEIIRERATGYVIYSSTFRISKRYGFVYFYKAAEA